VLRLKWFHEMIDRFPAENRMLVTLSPHSAYPDKAEIFLVPSYFSYMNRNANRIGFADNWDEGIRVERRLNNILLAEGRLLDPRNPYEKVKKMPKSKVSAVKFKKTIAGYTAQVTCRTHWSDDEFDGKGDTKLAAAYALKQDLAKRLEEMNAEWKLVEEALGKAHIQWVNQGGKPGVRP